MTDLTRDPAVPEWSEIELPETWVDRMELHKPGFLAKLLRSLFRRSKSPRVQVPDTMPGRDRIPKYVLQEFHNLPNGNYSTRITRGYVTSFDKMMLGTMGESRQQLATDLAHCHSVLDVGCGGGQTAAVLSDNGIAEVWGVDPSPYLLMHAAGAYPHLKFVQAIAEDTGFPDQRFDGIAVNFVFHEIPPRYRKQALAELNRILRPGGRLVICEPDSTQLYRGWWHMLRHHGWRGVYFKFLAHSVYEPFVHSWHKEDTTAVFGASGFRILRDWRAMPVRHLVAEKV